MRFSILRRALLGAMAVGMGMAATFAAPTARADEFINILTGGTAGVYYPLGVALSKIYGEQIPGARPAVQATKASVENLNLLQQGRGELAFALGDSVGFAWAGDMPDTGFSSKLDKLRGMAAIYANVIQIVATKDSGITTLADLRNKRVSVGAPKSGTELNARAILEAAGLGYSDLAKVEFLPFAESVELMKNRQIDVTLQSAGLGVASIRDLATNNDIVVVAIPAEIVDKIGAPYIPSTIPGGTYRGQDADVATAAVGNFLITHSGVSDELVYQMTKATFESLPQLAAAHAAAKGISLAGAKRGMPLPLHPGAARYYDEHGIK
jgi:uncharacterized protein